MRVARHGRSFPDIMIDSVPLIACELNSNYKLSCRDGYGYLFYIIDWRIADGLLHWFCLRTGCLGSFDCFDFVYRFLLCFLVPLTAQEENDGTNLQYCEGSGFKLGCVEVVTYGVEGLLGVDLGAVLVNLLSDECLGEHVSGVMLGRNIVS